jgi:hypothetical protein
MLLAAYVSPLMISQFIANPMNIIKPFHSLLTLFLIAATSHAQTSCNDLLVSQDKMRRSVTYRTLAKGDLLSSKAMISASRSFSKNADVMTFTAGATGDFAVPDSAAGENGLFLLFEDGSNYRNDSAHVRTAYGDNIGTILGVSVPIDSTLLSLLEKSPVVSVRIGFYTGEPNKWTAESLPTMLVCLLKAPRPGELK